MVWSLRGRLNEVRERDRKFIMQIDIKHINSLLWPLYIGFICLEFLDVYSTLVALRGSQVFLELNPIAGTLFSLRFGGFLLAMVLKYLPAVPLFYAVFVKDERGMHPYEIRLVKFIALVALLGADAIMLYVVVVNNLPLLIRGFIDGHLG